MNGTYTRVLLVGRITGRFQGVGAARPGGAGFTVDCVSGPEGGFAATEVVADVATLLLAGVTFDKAAGLDAGAALADGADTTGAFTGSGGAGAEAFVAGGAGVTAAGAGVTVTATAFFFEGAGELTDAAGGTADDCFVEVVLVVA